MPREFRLLVASHDEPGFERMIPRSLLTLFLLAEIQGGCASRGGQYHPPNAQPPRSLTSSQLMGLESPDMLVRDPVSGVWAQPEVLTAFWALERDAAVVGWRLTIISGYRTFESQRRVWNRKYESARWVGSRGPVSWIQQTMKYISVPGFSRHHWGTDLDLGEMSLRKAELPKGVQENKMREFYDWLEVNAPRYGFCRVYRGGAGSIQDEPWHWSYVRLAAVYDRDFHRISDFSVLKGRGVAGWDWLSENFAEVKRLQVDSVQSECQVITDPSVDVED